MPSPQLELQASPVAQTGSAWHVDEQPSNGAWLPSSQLSAPSCKLSPQVVGVHTTGLPSHLKPASRRQRSEQPSPLKRSPSSQPSLGSVTPSPHKKTRVHVTPGSRH